MRGIAVVCVLGCLNVSMAQDAPVVTIYANAFEALEIVSKLGSLKTRIVLVPKKTEVKALPDGSVPEKLKKELLQTFALMVFDMSAEMAKKNPKLAQRLDDAFGLEEAKRNETVLTIVEEYLKIRHDDRPLLERCEKIVWWWLASNNCITIVGDWKK